MRHPSLKCHPHHLDMAGSWWVINVALSAIRVLLFRHICLHYVQLKRVRKMVRRREMRMCTGGWMNLMILNLVRMTDSHKL